RSKRDWSSDVCSSDLTWLDWALKHPELLLIDHAHCEKKAASTALKLMFRYVERDDLLRMLSQLAREELLHFEQVLAMMAKRQVAYCHLRSEEHTSELQS